MQSSRNKHISSRKKALPLQNPELMTAQLTLNKSPVMKQAAESQKININPREVLQQAEELFLANDALECINLLKGLFEYLRNIKYNDQKILILIHTNLAVSYYKIGFLEEAYDQFSSALSTIKDISLSTKNPLSSRSNSMNSSSINTRFGQKIRYDMLTARIQLQTCILFSEMGKHQLALQHARISCKSCYNMIYDLQIILYQNLNILLTSQNKNKTSYTSAYDPQSQIKIDGYENLINNIVIIDQLLLATKDLRIQYLAQNKDKVQLLDDEKNHINRIGKLPSKSNLELLYALVPENVDALWIFKNKILDQIQMKFMEEQTLENRDILQNVEVIEKVVYLAISLYCYSTETRFLEKDSQEKDPCGVLDSEHWLSRSLEIAYTFMPHQAPILNQILTVHDRFHGIDKQTIPEDRQVQGFFKVLRPLSKPKSIYTSSKNILCSPIMIRIQVPKIQIQEQSNEIQIDEQFSSHNKDSNKTMMNKVEFANKTIDLDSITKNNKIRGLNNSKKFDFTEISQSVIRRKHNTKIDFTDNIKSIYASRKIKSTSEHNNNLKAEKMKINLTAIKDLKDEENGSKSIRRPHSYDRQINKPNDQHFFPIQTQRKKKSFSQNRRDGHKQRRSVTSNSAGLKLDGLQVLPSSFKKPDEQDCFQFNGKMANIQASKMGGNIFINNNINLFISKDSIENSNLKDHKTVYETSKRQNYMNRRKAHNSNFTGSKNPDFLL